MVPGYINTYITLFLNIFFRNTNHKPPTIRLAYPAFWWAYNYMNGNILNFYSGYIGRLWTGIYWTFIPEPTARSAVRRGLLIPHGYLHPGKSEHSEVLLLRSVAKCKVHQWLRARRYGSSFKMHGWSSHWSHDCKEWNGQRFKKKHVRKLKYCFTQYDGKHCFKFCSLKG